MNKVNKVLRTGNVWRLKQRVPCNECKYFMKGKSEDDYCRLFMLFKDDGLHYENVVYCREKEYLCGPDALYFEEKVINTFD